MKREERDTVLALSESPGMISDDDRGFFVKLGKRIAELRRRKALTQTKLAEELDVSQKTVNAFEHGTRRVPVSLLPALAEKLDVTIEEIVSGVGAAPRKLGKRGPRSRIEEQMELIRSLPRSKQKFVIDMIDTVLAQADRASNG